MSERTWLGVGLVAMSLAASSPVLAQGAFSADADFVSNPSDCVESEVHVFVRGGANGGGEIEASVVEVDDCEGQTLLDARTKTDLPSGALSWDGRSVILDAPVQMLDATTNNAISMEFALQWDGGERIVATTKRDLEAPGKVVALDRATRRTLLPAEAWGSVSSDGKSYVDGPAEDAAITLTR